MMNKKGFTVIELVVSFSILAVILASIIGFTIYYRDKVRDEQLKTQLYDYKNTMLKMVYDNIVAKKYKKIEACEGVNNCVNFVDNDGNNTTLKIMQLNGDNGLYLNYNGVNYLLPDSNIMEGGVHMCEFKDFDLQNHDNSFYTLKITYLHHVLNEEYDILIAIN